MKKFLSALLSSAIVMSNLSVLPFITDAAEKSQYEFEKGTIVNSGENGAEITAVNGASAGKAVDLKDGGNTVSLTVNAENSGAHRLSIRYNQPYDEGGKYQNIIVNGKSAGEIFCEYTGDDFGVVSVNADLKKGSNEIAVEASWGWTKLDCLLVEEGTISNYTGTAKLSNPNSTAKTQALYNYLCDTYGKNVISGQQESTWMGSENYEFDIIKNASGKYPAIRGLDYMGDDFSGCNRRAIDWYKRGGIVTICWHCGSDFRGSHTESLDSDLNWSSALTPGTNEYNALIAGMDKGAKALLELKEAGIPVIWRPFHEFDGKWFWWGKGGAENFKKLWRIMYDRYTNHWGLDNLIWNLGYCGDVNSGWYPGDEYVDIIGADTYVNHTESLVSMYNKTAQVANKPVCLHENGPIPDPEKMKSDGAKWLWFMTWHTSFIDSNQFNTASYISRIYNSDYMITLDELPDVYSYGSSSSGGDNTPVFTIEPPEALMGDLNNDGKVNTADAVILEKWILGTGSMDSSVWKNADLCSDGVIDSFDMIKMRKLIFEKKNTNIKPSQPSTNPVVTEKRTSYPNNDFQWVNTDYLNNSWAPQGKVERFWYDTRDNANGGNTVYKKSALVYVPAGYDSSKKYNVLYLMHGGSDSPEWFFGGEGKSSNITRMMDSMIAAGDIEPLIVCAVSYYTEYRSDDTSNCLNFHYELTNDIIPVFEKKYSTYANGNVSEESLEATRLHRGFAGFSMGSVTTWSVFEHCLDKIAYYMPISGDCWALGGTAGGSQSDGTAWYLASKVKENGKTAKDFYIYSGCGEWDIAEPNLTPQINSMKNMDDPFIYTNNFANGNLYHVIYPGGGHDVNTVTAVMYNGLPKMFG